jgi:hypothetical protein
MAFIAIESDRSKEREVRRKSKLARPYDSRLMLTETRFSVHPTPLLEEKS